MRVGIDPKVDYAFKRIFGRDHPVNHRLLVSLLNAVLKLSEGERITAVQILNPFHDRQTSDDRLSVVDLKVRDQQNRQYSVEMQMLLHPFFPERLLYYWAKSYPQPLTTGQDYDKLRTTVVICFLDDVLWKKHPNQYHWHFQLRDRQLPVVLTPHLSIHVLELPKFHQAVEELGEPLEQWLYFLRHAAEMDTECLPERLQVIEIRQALEELQMLSQDHMERELYEARLRIRLDENIRARAAEIHHATGFEEGKKEGKEEGKKEGKEEGIKEGKEEGIKEGIKENLVLMIPRLQRMSKRETSTREELLALSFEQLQTLADQLDAEFFGSTGE